MTGLANMTIAYCGETCQGRQKIYGRNQNGRSNLNVKIINISVYKMVTGAFAVIMIQDLYQHQIWNATVLVPGIKLKSVVPPGDLMFMN